ncbi:MAG: cytidylate kinase-like family protein [Candidatus Zixiibacteriota bacterium]
MSSIDAIIDRQLKKWEMEKGTRHESIDKGEPIKVLPLVTVSRERGSRGAYIAEKLAEKLGYQLLHKEVIDKICNSSGYRRQIIESLDEETRSAIDLWAEAVFKGIYVDASDYFRHLYKVIISISELGGVVVVGRGANFMLKEDQGFHIRVVASIPKRIRNLMQYEQYSYDQAEQELKAADRSRAYFVKSNFKRDINDPGAYDFIANTTLLNPEDIIDMIEIGIKSKLHFIQHHRNKNDDE